MFKMKTKSSDNWTDVINACRTTVSKAPIESSKTSSEFKTKLLISEHSPIRLLSITWTWENIKSWCATHWVRHKWECFVSTRRSDRTGVYRDSLRQDELVDFMGNANSQALIDTMRKRLCHGCSKETREYALQLKREITEIEPELGFVLVPNCVYRGGCPELNNCGFYDRFIEESCNHGQRSCELTEEFTNIYVRYYVYNEHLEQEFRKELI